VRNGADLFRIIGAVVALGALFPIASLATDGGKSEARTQQAGEDRWVPSLAITSGITVQQQDGFSLSELFEDGSPPPVALQPDCDPRNPHPSCPDPIPFDGDDVAVSPFVGGTLELMAPALPIPTRPRLFVSGEILPTFASDRDLALDGDPGCLRGPEIGVPCAKDEDGTRRRAFGEDAINGQGSSTSAEVDTLVFGASLGVAFPLQFGKRQLRIKPSVGWINYEVDAEGLVVDAECDPVTRCTDVTPIPGGPTAPGFLRETVLSGSDSQRFNGIGPGLDIEMDTGRYGTLGVSVFTGFRAYAIVGDRTVSFGAEETFDDQLGMDRAVAQFEVEVDPWIFRAHAGIRFHWLGSEK